VGGRVYDLVCANLIAPLLIEHAQRLCARMHPRSRLVLAGILTEQFGGVQRCFERHGLELVRSRIEREWRSGTFQRR
jgi:ribosomal protein L11 methylase PrmA